MPRIYLIIQVIFHRNIISSRATHSVQNGGIIEKILEKFKVSISIKDIEHLKLLRVNLQRNYKGFILSKSKWSMLNSS